MSPAERQALEGLLGRPPKLARSIQLSHTELDRAVARAGLATDLRSALETLDGPIVDRRSEQIRMQEAWRAVLANVNDQRLIASFSDSAGVALLKRCAGGDPAHAVSLIVQAERVLALLPASGTSRAQLAAHALGDSHALDVGQPVASLVLRACRVSKHPLRIGTEDAEADDIAEGSAARGDSSAEARGLSVRDQWARVGVVVSELAAPALCLNLSALGASAGAQLVRAAKETAEPFHLSLRALLRDPPIWDVAGVVVSICENASIVAAAADRLQHRCAPLVCTDGMPGAAQQVLLQQLAAAGARLLYHGDFDWPGIRIGNFVMREFSAQPWRFGVTDYLAAAASGLPLPAEGQVLADWDAQLAPTMTSRGFVLHEERVIELLLGDLKCS
ncbi:TIGR02679 family protein [Steroidobacter sp. S1-65]|uniref:TIGR02679 family protein n=1 Tax=Steroidobacter gossypii TaxID=2805490 RepID=A0ABS1WX47_9GAMM|nr:TIGR02679 family protein [Steroidobacter gossypii]MBM0105555.1 TIGR02679 family protein [Steroidobacter gossypii]